MSPERVCAIIMACAVLHNIAIERREPEPPPVLEEEQEEERDEVEGDGGAVRDYMAQTFFA